MRLLLVLVVSLISLEPILVLANDAAAETAAGGLQLRLERRVSMMKERLYIGKRFTQRHPSNVPTLQNRYPVTVEYEFLNDSAEDVTTEVAFPLPEYGYPGEDLIQDRRVHGFKVEVDGRPLPYSTHVLAKVDGRDVTDVLRVLNVDVETFGHFEHDGSPDKYQVSHLAGDAQARLKATGAVDEDLWPRWKVAVTHHWRQTFPARRVVRVRHEYEAIAGFSYDYDVDRYLAELQDGCFDGSLRKALQAAQTKKSGTPGEARAMVSAEWVKYILTTANTWKTPVPDFELVVERPEDQFVSFCWDGKVERVSKTKFRVSARDFVPTHELLVYFFSVSGAPEHR